jgi:DNA repair exonuclease SbcCD nuclease subunit
VPKAVCNILHTSDIHLDNDIGDTGNESPGQLGFIQVIDMAIKMRVQLFLLAGDLFDHNRVKQPCLDFTSAQLARLNCPVVMISGNHDCLADYSIYRTYDPTNAGDHIHFIKEENGAVVDFDSLGVRVWGKGIVDHHPGNKPLDCIPTSDFDGWYIGMTHGYYIGRGADSYSSIITPEEIAGSGFDYLALGHVHVFATMQHGATLAAYPGSPNIGQGIKEKTVAHIVLDPVSGVTVNRLVL